MKRLIVFLAFFVFGTTSCLNAATYYWNGGASGTWNSTGSWSSTDPQVSVTAVASVPGGTAAVSDDVFFNFNYAGAIAAISVTLANNIPSAGTINSITYNGVTSVGLTVTYTGAFTTTCTSMTINAAYVIMPEFLAINTSLAFQNGNSTFQSRLSGAGTTSGKGIKIGGTGTVVVSITGMDANNYFTANATGTPFTFITKNNTDNIGTLFFDPKYANGTYSMYHYSLLRGLVTLGSSINTSRLALSNASSAGTTTLAAGVNLNLATGGTSTFATNTTTTGTLIDAFTNPTSSFTFSASGSLDLTGKILFKTSTPYSINNLIINKTAPLTWSQGLTVTNLTLTNGTIINSTASSNANNITIADGGTITRSASTAIITAPPVFAGKANVTIGGTLTAGSELLGSTGSIGTLTVNNAFTYTLNACGATGTAITSAGVGYASAPTVTFSSPTNGTTATGVALVSAGVLTTIYITNPGSGYTSTPTITIAAPPTAAAWAPNTVYATNAIVTNDGGKIYVSISTAGTARSAGSGGPTGTGTSIVDLNSTGNSVTWKYIGSAVSTATATATYNSPNTLTMDALTIGSGTSGIVSFPNNSAALTVTINNDVTVNAGASFTAGTQTNAVLHTLNIGGNISGTGTFNMTGSGTTKAVDVTFNNASSSTITAGTLSFNSVTLNKSTGISMSASASIANTLTLTNGTLTVGANTLTIAGLPTVSTGIIDATNSSATVVFTNTSSAVSLPSATCFNGNINSITLNGSGGITLNAALTIPKNLTLTSGTFDVSASNFDLNIGGNYANNGGTFTARSGTVTFNGTTQTIGGTATTSFYNLSTSGSSSATTGFALTVTNNLVVGEGTTLSLAGFTFSVGGTTSIGNALGSGTTGSLIFTSGTSSKTFTGLVTVYAGGTFSTANQTTTVNFAGGITNNGTFNSSSISSGTFNFTANQDMRGAGTLATTIYFNTTNLSTGVTINNYTSFSSGAGLSAGGAGCSWVQQVNSTFYYGSTTLPTSNFTFVASTNTPNTVNYNRNNNQTVLATDYSNLTLSTGPTKTLSANLVVLGNLFIDNGATLNTTSAYTVSVTGTTTVGGGTSGTFTVATSSGTNSFTGLVTVANGGTWNNSSGNFPITFQGGISNSGTFTAGSGVHTFSTNAQALSGTLSLPSVTVTAITLTNNGNLTITTALAGTGTFTQGNNSTVNLGMSGLPGITAMTATATGNTVNYNRSGTQTIFGCNYVNLTLSGTSAKTFSSPTATISGNLTLSGTASVTSTGIPLAIGGDFTISEGTSFTVNANNFTVSGNTFIGNSNGLGTSGTLSYSSSTGTRVFSGNFTIYAGGTWNNPARAHSPTVGGDLTNNGTLILGASGTYSVGGNFTNNGTFTANGATVSMTSTTTGKSITGTFTGANAFFGLTFNGVGGAWTLPSTTDVTGTFTITNGAVTAPSTNLNLTVNFANSGTFTHNSGTVTFLGTTQSISGTSTTQFYNLTTANTTAVTIAANSTVANNLTIADGTTFSIGAFTFTVSGTTTVGTTGGAASSLIINSSTGTKTFTGNVTLANNATFSITNNPVIIFGGDLTNNGIFLAGSTSAHAISIAGNFTQVGSFTAGIGTFTFNSTSTGKTITGTFTGTAGSYNLTGGFYNIVFNGVGGAWTLPNNVDLGGTFTVTNGTVTAGNGTINVTGAFSNAATFTNTSGTMNLASNFTNSGTYNHNSGTVNFTGTSRFITSTTGSTTTNFYNLSTSGTATISSGTSTFNVLGNLSIGDGTSLTISNTHINVTGTTNVGAGTSGSLIISSSTGTKVFAGDFNINSGATLNISGASAAISLQGNFTLAATGIMTGVSSSIITFSATTTRTITGTFTGTNAFNNLTFNGVGGVWVLPSDVDVNSAFNLSAGNLTAPSGNLKVGGSFTSVSSATFNHNNGTIQFTGSSTFGNSTCTFKNVTINSGVTVTIGSGSSISYAGNISNSGTLSMVASSTFVGTSVLSGTGLYSFNTTTINASCSLTSTASNNVTFIGSFTNNGTFIHNNGTINLAGTSAFLTLGGNLTSATNGGFYKLIFNTTGTWKVNATTDVANDLTITSGTFAPGAFTVNVGGNFSNTGTFTGTSSTINFNGASAQTIAAATFNNLTINNATGVTLSGNVTASGVLTFTTGVVTTGSNTLTLTNNSSATAALSGTPSSTNYVNGNLIRTVSNAFSGYVFPVGQNVSGTDYYYPLTLSNLSGTANVTVAAFNGSTGGGAADNTTLSDISANEYWQVVASSAITAKISVTTAMIGSYEVIGTSVGSVPTGTYSSIGGALNLGTNSILVSSSTSIPTTGNYAYFVVASSSLPAPTITSFTSDFPTSTSYYSGSVLTITGTNFGATTSVAIGGASATVSAFTSTQLTVTVPTGVSGNTIAVSNSGGSDNTTGTYLTGILSTQAGDWSTASTWFTNAVPGSASTVIIRHAVTLNTTPSSPANLTVVSTGSLTLGTTVSSVITVTSSVTNSGTINLGTVNKSGQFTCGGTFTNSGTFTVGSTVASGLNQYGYLTLNGSSTNTGTILIDNGSTSATLMVGGALVNNGTITNNAIVQLNAGGSISGNGIVYASNSNLYYNTGTSNTVGSGAEWQTGTSSSAIGDAGIPYNVQVGKVQTGTLNSSTSLTIGSYMKALGTVSTNSTYSITVNNGAVLNAGKIGNSGTLNVGTADISSMAILGNAANATAISGSLSSMTNAGTLNIYGYFQYFFNAISTATGTVNVRPYAVYDCGGSAPKMVNTGATYAANSYVYLSSPTNITSINITDSATTPTFGNVIINSVAQTSNISTQNLANVAGTLYILNTNTGSIRNSATNLSLGGLQVGGSLSFNGSVINATAASFALASTTGLATQVNGDINIGSNGTLTTVSATTVSLTGNWTNSGTFTSTSTNVAFNGSSNQNIGATTFPANLTINNAAGVTATAAVSVASTGTLALNNGVFSLAPATATTYSLPCTITRTSGSIDASNANATLAFTGSSARTIPASTFAANINALTINNSGGVTLNADATVDNTLTLTAGTLTLGGNLTLKADVSVTSGNINATAGTVTYNGTAAQTLTTANYTSSTINALVVNNSNGVSITGNLTNSGSLTLSAGTLSTTGTLTVNGSTSATSGNINASTATVVYSGSSAQSIPAGTFTGNVQNLTINNAAGVTLGGTLNITGTLTPTAGVLTTGGYLVIRSTSTGTGRIAQGSGSYISGDVTVERFIPAKATRKYSFITSPVTQLIRNGWQQQMYITGAGTGGTTCGTTTGNGVAGTDKYNSNGFDKTITNTPSFYYYNVSPVNGTRWTTISNTISTSLTPGKGYRTNIRGDRNLGTCNDQLLSNSPAAPTDVTLSASGTVTTGDLTVNLNAPATHLYTLVGNPYPSAISFTAFKTDNTTISNKLWSYSPNGNGNYTTYAAGIIANAATGYNNTNGDYIASGQAFFVEANNTGSTVLFKESHKTVGTIPNNQYFGLLNSQIIRVGLKNTNLEAIDEVVVRFANTGSKNYLADVDAVSFGGGNQYLQTIKPAYKLAIATRPANFSIDTVQLAVMSNATGDFVLNMNSIDGFDGSTVITLRDKFLGTTQDVVANPAYAFSVTNDSLSKGINRFELVFKQTTTLPVQFVAIKATKEATQNHISWTVANEKNLQSYEVEKSTDGVHYVSIATVKATNAASYSSNDIARTVAKTIYYRIKAVDQDGTIAYSKTATITNNPAVAEYTVSLYPMPVKAQLQIALNHASADKYSVQIKSMDGKAVWSKSGIAAEAGILQIDVHQLAAGTYSLFLTNSNGQQTISKLVKE